MKAAMLDLALSNIDWMILFPEAEVKHLPMVSSDHALLLICTTPQEDAVNQEVLDMYQLGPRT